MNRENLQKLADYLLNLPRGYRHFDMGMFAAYPEATINCPADLPAGFYGDCGTVACALGHGPAAGISHKGPYWDNTWYDYCYSAFDLNFYEAEAQWCFGYQWESIDNTPHGAGKRIKRLLDKGLPENW